MMSKKKKGAEDDDVIIIRLWPKTPLLYPMAIMALICGIAGLIFGTPQELVDNYLEDNPAAQSTNEGIEAKEAKETTGEDSEEAVPEVEKAEPEVEGADDVVAPLAVASESKPVKKPVGIADKIHTIMAILFLATFAFSLFVVCIDFEVRWSMLGFALIMIIILAIFGADRLGYIQLPNAFSVLSKFTLFATELFYFSVFLIWLVLMLVSAVIARLHYVKIEHNEVIEYGGVMESQKRMSTMRMHWTKEIKDVCEYWLPFVRSGTLVFTFPNEEKPLILNNVLHINKVLKKLDKKSSSFQFKGE